MRSKATGTAVEGAKVPDQPWVVLMTHPTIASYGTLDGQAFLMLAVETELQAAGIEVGWDPFRPGEGFQSIFDRASGMRPLNLLVRQSDLERAQVIAQDMQEEG